MRLTVEERVLRSNFKLNTLYYTFLKVVNFNISYTVGFWGLEPRWTKLPTFRRKVFPNPYRPHVFITQDTKNERPGQLAVPQRDSSRLAPLLVGSVAHPGPYPPQKLWRLLMWFEYEADHLPPRSTSLKNVWKFNSTPLSLFCSVQHTLISWPWTCSCHSCHHYWSPFYGSGVSVVW